MRRLLFVVVLVPLLLGTVLTAYRVLGRDYRYFQLLRLGDQLLAEELPFQATRTYGSAIGLKPDEPMGYFKRAEAERRQGNLVPALQDLEKAASLSPDRPLASMRLADLHYELGHFEDATKHYESVLALDPESATLWYKLGLVRFRAGHEAEAIEALSRAAAIRHGFWEAYYMRGGVFQSLGGFDEAEADYRRALELSPEAGVAREALINLYLASRQTRKVLPLIQQEIDANPGAATPYLHLADTYSLAGRRTEAIEAVSLALEQDPNLPGAYLRLGELWLSEANLSEDPIALDKAISALESVTRMDPSNGRAALALGRAYLATGDAERAFAELQRASEATPAQAEAHRLLGDLYRARDNQAEAVTAYHVYLKLRGENSDVLERLGDTYVELGKPAMAAEVYMKLVAIEPRRVTPIVKAARAFLASGDSRGAASACRRGLVANPENPALLTLLSQAQEQRRSPSQSQ